MAIRKKLNHDDRTRAKIKTSQLINRLTDHVLGKVDLSASQVSAALGLIKKTLPDLQAMSIEAQVTHHDARELTDSELANIATAGSAGASKQKGGEKEPNQLH